MKNKIFRKGQILYGGIRNHIVTDIFVENGEEFVKFFGVLVLPHDWLGKKYRYEMRTYAEAEIDFIDKRYKSICPHCDKYASLAMLRRWHFDNCKSLRKPKSTKSTKSESLPDISNLTLESSSTNLE